MGIRGIFLPKSWLARFQVMEYLRAFLYGRLGMSSFGMLFVVSGAFGVFRRDLLLEIGGFSTRTVGEDFEAVVRLHLHLRRQRRPYRVVMVPDPVCWTEVPERLATLGRQRNRWQRGLLETMWTHRGMVLRPSRERLGLVSLLHFLVLEALAPLIELGGYLIFLGHLVQGHVNAPYVVLFLLVALFLGFLNSVVAILLEVNGGHRYQGLGPFLTLLAAALLENLGYRQFTVAWRLMGTLDFLRGKGHWGSMHREGALRQR
jgi:cellulose synthase/poly-beta-1,6-N-acetylglucosamine synthase-like glycosyltransferase